MPYVNSNLRFLDGRMGRAWEHSQLSNFCCRCNECSQSPSVHQFLCFVLRFSILPFPLLSLFPYIFCFLSFRLKGVSSCRYFPSSLCAVYSSKINKNCAWFEAVAAQLWDVMCRWLVVIYRRFCRTYRSQRLSRKVDNYQSRLHNIPEERRSQTQNGGTMTGTTARMFHFKNYPQADSVLAFCIMFWSEFNFTYRYGITEDFCCVENQDKIGYVNYSCYENRIRVSILLTTGSRFYLQNVVIAKLSKKFPHSVKHRNSLLSSQQPAIPHFPETRIQYINYPLISSFRLTLVIYI